MDREQQVKTFINSLIKTIKSYKLYRNRSNLPEKFLKETYEVLGEILEEGPLKIGINSDSIIHNESVIYRDENKITSLPLFLYRNGIRDITFLEELSFEELESFVKIIAESEFVSDLNLSEDLWEHNFVNIIFTIVELPMEDYSWIVQDRVEVFNGGIKFAGMSTKEREETHIKTERLSDNILEYLPEESREDALVYTIFKLLSLETNQDRIIQIVSTLGEYLERNIEEGEVAPISIFLRYYEENAEKLISAREYLEDLREIICGERAVKLYKFTLNKGEKKHVPDVLKILGFCGKCAIMVIEESITESTEPELLKEFQKILFKIGQQDPTSIAHLLELDNPVIANLCLEIINELSDSYFIPYLEKMLKKNILRDKAIKVLVRLLPRKKLIELTESSDPFIRLNAYRELNYIVNDQELDMFLERVGSPDFWNLPPEERKYLLRLLSTRPTYDAIRVFSWVLGKYTMNPEHIDTKLYAVKLLGKMKNEDAFRILKKYRWTRHLRKAIKEALKNYEKG